MNVSQFVGVTTWFSILCIIFGVLFGVIESNFITWFLFGFLCLVGFLRALFSISENRKSS